MKAFHEGFKAFKLVPSEESGETVLQTERRKVRVTVGKSIKAHSAPLKICSEGVLDPVGVHYCPDSPADCYCYYPTDSILTRVRVDEGADALLNEATDGFPPRSAKACASSLTVLEVLEGEVTSKDGLTTLIFKKGVLHNTEGPAWVQRDKSGAVLEEIFVEQGCISRPPEEGPCKILRHENGWLKQVVYGAMDSLHRPTKDGPALVCWNERGVMTKKAFYEGGVLNRPAEKGPAFNLWSDAGVKLQEIYCQKFIKHRPPELGPACTFWDEKGEMDCMSFYKNGVMHRLREDGPAWTSFEKDEKGTRWKKVLYFEEGRIVEPVHPGK